MLRTLSGFCFVTVFGAVALGQLPGQDTKHIDGQIVAVSPDQNRITIRVTDGNVAKDIQFDVIKTTKFWGTDQKLIENGLYFGGFKNGTAVWFQRGAGSSSSTLLELRLHNPKLPPPDKK